MKIYRIANILPDVWLDTPDNFESQGIKWHQEILPIDKIMEVAWTVNATRIPMEKMFKKNERLPLILVKNTNGVYELSDGQHRFAAYKNIFPNIKFIKAAVFEDVLS